MKFRFNYIKTLMLILYIAFPCNFYSQEVSYSLHDAQGVPLDQKLIDLMNFHGGIFIEAGANDGITQSNTKRLEEYYGWKGILVEPSAYLFPALCENRPNSHCYSCALGSFDQNNSYIEGDFDGSLMSSVDGFRLHRSISSKVAVKTLQSILDETKLRHIHLLSLDVEGYELQVIKGIDFNLTTFDYLLIEIYCNQYEEIVSFLSQNGYIMQENFTNYTCASCPNWDGTHNDYLFKRKSLDRELLPKY